MMIDEMSNLEELKEYGLDYFNKKVEESTEEDDDDSECAIDAAYKYLCAIDAAYEYMLTECKDAKALAGYYYSMTDSVKNAISELSCDGDADNLTCKEALSILRKMA